MTETAIKDINRFCWRRMWQFGGLYRRAIVAQIIIYTVIEALMTIVTSVFPYDSTILGACVVILLLSLALPFVFYTADDTIIRLAPVKASERITFYLLWLVILLPLILGTIQWFLMYIGWLFEPNGLMTFTINNIKKACETLNAASIAVFYLAYYVSGCMTVVIFLDAVITCRHPILSSIMRYVLFIISVIIISIVIGIVYQLKYRPLTQDKRGYFILLVQGAVALASLPVTILGIRHIYKYFR